MDRFHEWTPAGESAARHQSHCGRRLQSIGNVKPSRGGAQIDVALARGGSVEHGTFFLVTLPLNYYA